MKVNRLLLLTLLTATILMGCDQPKNIVTIEKEELLKTEVREIKTFASDGLKSLEALSYSYSTKSDEKIVALIFKANDKWSYREYWLKNGETLTLKGDEGQLLYLSLPANRTIAYSWCLISSEQTIKGNEVAYNEWIHIPFKNEREVEGENYDRQVFDLSTLNKSLPFKLQYKYNGEIKNDIFECFIENPVLIP